MKSLDTLLRLRREELDAIRAELGRLEGERSEILARERALEREYREEREKARELESSYVFLAYSAVVARQRELLAAEKAAIAQRIEGVRGRVNEAFREFKKIDITQDRRQAAERVRQAKSEQGQLDEMGLTIFRRREPHPGLRR